MKREFPLFQSHLDLAHRYWKEILKPGDHAIDATCGNGKDTLILAKFLFSQSLESSLIGIDIQAKAIARTRASLTSHLSKKEYERVFLYHQSHATFPLYAHQVPIRLIIYNFGYLPGSDKSITTLKTSSLQSFQAALSLIIPTGAISATCYPGHPEGAQEEQGLLDYVRTLDPAHFSVSWHTWPNRKLSPSLLFIQKSM